MAARVREWNDASGAHTELLRPDGSWKRWTNGVVVAESGPDSGRAEAYAAGNYDAVAEAIRYGEQFEASPYGRRILEQERRAGERAREVSDRDYDLERDRFGLSEREYDRRFALDERKFGLDERETEANIAELERRFGLDYAQQGIDFFKTAADYAKTPKSWLESIQFQSPQFMSRFAQGLSNPAFGAKGANLPQMNNITDSVSAATGGGGLNSNLYDPGKAISQIVKASPPSSVPGFTGQDIAAVNLIAELFKKGGGGMQEGVWESYSPEQRDLITGTMDWMAPNGGANFEREIALSRLPRRSNPFSSI